MLRLRLPTAAAAALAALGLAMLPANAQAPSPAPAAGAAAPHARFSQAPAYTGDPNLQLGLSLFLAGGGPSSFDAMTLIGALAGSRSTAELVSLNQQFGEANVRQFAATFDYLLADAVRIGRQSGMQLPGEPSPAPDNPKLLAAALYAAGVTPAGNFDPEYLLDHILSHALHASVMNDIDADAAQGVSADRNFHAVLAQLVQDLKVQYGS